MAKPDTLSAVLKELASVRDKLEVRVLLASNDRERAALLRVISAADAVPDAVETNKQLKR